MKKMLKKGYGRGWLEKIDVIRGERGNASLRQKENSTQQGTSLKNPLEHFIATDHL
jgi:hypothetical protein